MSDIKPADELLAKELEIIDLDDVEGHGLREVAAGLGAAAVLAGGAGAAVASTSLGSSLPTVPPRGSISVTAEDPIGTADRATDQAVTSARAARDTGIAKAGATADTATSTAVSTERSARDAAGTVADYAARDIEAATTIAGNAAGYAGGAAGAAVQSAVTAATTTAGTAGSTVRDTDRKVATVLSVVASGAQGSVNTVTASLKAVNAGAGVDVQGAGGWVLVKAGDAVLAQVRMEGGSATASWTVPLAGAHSVTLTYTGDDTFAPSLRTIAV